MGVTLLHIRQPRFIHFFHDFLTLVDQECLLYGLVDDQLFSDQIFINLSSN